MSEADTVAETRRPATVDSLRDELHALGVTLGQTLIVHTSLSRLGWVNGGAIAVIEALTATLGPSGTLVMPTHTTGLTDPSGWCNPPVPESWWQTIRESMPAFDPRVTPSTHMGAVAEAFRPLPGVLRSNHPVGSFAARGPNANSITTGHPLEDVFGDGSPLGRLEDFEASILLLGVEHENNTSLHLAEARAFDQRWREQGSPVMEEGQRVWKRYRERLHDSDDFPWVAEAYVAGGGTVRESRVGTSLATLTPMRELVDFATRWMVEHPGARV